jgi:hypothetical protein
MQHWDFLVAFRPSGNLWYPCAEADRQRKDGDMATTVEQVLRDIKSLTREEQRHVRDALDGILRLSTDIDETELVRLAATRGIHITVPTEEMTDEEFDRFQPIVVRGEPISETIIRERR